MNFVKIRNTALVKGFRQSAPYVNAHRHKTFVIMLGGEAIEHKNFKNIVNDIALLNSLGIKIVLIYGARPQLEKTLSERHIPEQFHKSMRITDDETLTVIKQISGALQLDITARLSMSLNNTPMAHSKTNVVSGNFVIAQPIGIDDGIDYLHSGKLRRIDVEGITQQLANNSIVLIGPMASSVTGEAFNLQSEELAAQIAVKLQAQKLIGFCSEQGILSDDETILSEIFPNEAKVILDQKEAQGEYQSGTVRFLRSALTASHAGIPRSHLISYKIDGALIQELFSMDGIGTQIVMASSENTRMAQIDDIGGILELIRPLEQEGILVRRSREQLEQEISSFSVIDKEERIIGCAALYAFPEENMAEMACLAISPDYRSGDRGLKLLDHIKSVAKSQGIERLFVLTTKSLHWFREQGFEEITLDQLPLKKQELYNFQRNSKILAIRL